MSVDAVHPHFELASLRMMLFLAFTFIFVFSTDVRFIAQSSVKVDAQIHWCCCV